MFGVVGETHAHDSFELIWLTFSDKSLCTCDVKMFNLHIKQPEISRNRSKETKNWKECYFVILRLLSNKINLIFVS